MSLVDVQAEREMLCVMLSHATVLDSHPLPSDAWTTIAHEIVAASIRWLYDSGVRPTADSVVAHLTQTSRLAAVGGAMVVHEIEASGLGLPAEADRLYARLVALASLRRQQAHLMRALAAIERQDAAEATSECAAALASDDSQRAATFTMAEAALGSYARLTGPDEPSRRPVPTCIEAVDRDLVGSGRGDVVLVVARTNVGKTSFAMSTARRLMERGIRAGIISMEDPRHLLEDRIMSTESGVASRALRARDLSASQYDRVTEVAGVMHTLTPAQGYVMACMPGATEADVIRTASKMARVDGCQLIVLDYVQAVRCSTRVSDIREGLLTIGARFKAAMARLDTVGMLMSQVTTDADTEGRPPKLSHVRDCKVLESQCDTGIVLWEEGDYVMGRVEKSKAEGKGARFAMQRGPGGSLVECDAPEQQGGAYQRRGRA
jgi:replicative DNA helicase